MSSAVLGFEGDIKNLIKSQLCYGICDFLRIHKELIYKNDNWHSINEIEPFRN